MTELTRYLTLAGVLFGIGIYGLLTRRSQTGILISLGVTVGAIALVFVVFNHTVRPSDVSGYLFSIVLTALAGLYALALYPFISAKRESERGDLETEAELAARLSAPPLSLRNIITDFNSFASQISLAMFFIVSYLLARVSLEALGAFVLGVVALKYILLKRLREKQKTLTDSEGASESSVTDGDTFHAHLTPRENVR